jgi:hypothetical protein
VTIQAQPLEEYCARLFGIRGSTAMKQSNPQRVPDCFAEPVMGGE